MTHRGFRAFVLVATTLACSLVVTNESQATLLNWLFPNRAARQAYRLGCSPTVACYPAAGCNTCATACAPCQQYTVSYQPQTCYRTVWAQVPVTTYRAALATDPCTGCRVTVMRPCTTYAWQAQRVAHTTYRPNYCLSPVTCNPCTTCGTATAISGSTCSGCSSTTTYYTSPATTSTTTIVESPDEPTPAAGQGSEPADEPPSLNESGQLRQFNPSPPTTVAVDSTPTTTPITTQPQLPVSTRPLDVTPIPDIEAEDGNRAPQLLDPNDRRAALPVHQASLVHPIDWPEREIAPAVAQEPVATSPVDEEELLWDASGWEVVE